MIFTNNRVNVFFLTLFSVVVMLLCVWALPSQARGGLSLVRDTEIENALHEWGEPIFEVAGLDPKSINIILVQQDAINAFVAGGSNIFFYTGLISRSENPGEVIGVMAHETGHITGGHLIRTRDALERASYESMIGALLGIGAAIATGDAGAASALSLGGTGLSQRKFLAHSRVQESSADQAALSFLERAQLNPMGLASFMDKLKAEIYAPTNQQSEYVRTHPLVENRLNVLTRGIEKSPYKDKAYPAEWVEQHARMKAKLIGFTNPAQIPWVYGDQDRSIAAQYARAIAAYRAHRVDDALVRIDALIKAEPKNPFFLELKGQMLVDFGRGGEALAYYRSAIDVLDTAPLLRIALAHALIESAGQDNAAYLQEAIKNLEIALVKESRSTRVHRLLATAYGRLNDDSGAKVHLAEEALLQRRYADAKNLAEVVLKDENADPKYRIKAKDLLSFIESSKKG